MTNFSRALNHLAKWRAVFASRWLGTRLSTDPEAIAVRDFAEKYLLLRVEVTALAALCIQRRVFTEPEWQQQIVIECGHLERQLELSFPGFTATDQGMQIDTERASETVKGWPA